MSVELVETVGGDQPSESMERVVGALELWLRLLMAPQLSDYSIGSPLKPIFDDLPLSP